MNKKRVLAMLLVVVMCFSLLPAQAFAETEITDDVSFAEDIEAEMEAVWPEEEPFQAELIPVEDFQEDLTAELPAEEAPMEAMPEEPVSAGPFGDESADALPNEQDVYDEPEMSAIPEEEGTEGDLSVAIPEENAASGQDETTEEDLPGEITPTEAEDGFFPVEDTEENLPAETGNVPEEETTEPAAEELWEETQTDETVVEDQPGTDAPEQDTPASVRLVFWTEPADAVVSVYQYGPSGVRQEACPEEDGSFLVIPGEWLCAVSCEGYVPVEDVPLTVVEGQETQELRFTLTALPADETAEAPELPEAEQAEEAGEPEIAEEGGNPADAPEAEAEEEAEDAAETASDETAEEIVLEAEEKTATSDAAKGYIQDVYAVQGSEWMTVNAGEKVTLQVGFDWEGQDVEDDEGNFTPESTPTFTYRWEEHYTDANGNFVQAKLSDGNGISGATTDTLVLTSVPRDATYYCYVTGTDGSSGETYFYIDVENNLQVERVGDYWRQVRLGEGTTLEVSVTALDTSKLTYAWKNEAEEVVGTGATLKLTSVTKNEEYRCEVRDQYGGWSNDWFRVGVDNRLGLTSEGSGNNWNRIGVTYNKTAKLKVLASATDMSQLKYKWYEGRYHDDHDVKVLGTKTTFTTPAIKESKYYICSVTDRFGNKSYCSFEVIVENHLGVKSALTGKKTDLEVTKGEKTTLQVKATAEDSSKLRYRWYNNQTGSEKTLGTKAKISTIAINDFVRYTCVVSDQYGNEVECSFTVTPKNNLKLTAVGETTVYVKPNSAATLKVKATAKDKTGLTYRWYRNSERNQEMLDCKKATLTTEKLTGNCSYTCTVTDRYGKTASVQFLVRIQNNLKLVAVGAPEQYNGSNRYQIGVKPNTTKTLKVRATADDTSQLTYRWVKYWNPDGCYGNNWPGEVLSSKKASVKTVPIDRHYTYQCIVTDQYGNSAQVDIAVFVENHLSIRSVTKGDTGNPGNPGRIGVKYNSTATLKVKVTADDTTGLKYSWYRGWTDESGTWRQVKLSGTKASLKTAKVTGQSRYTCVVNDRYGHQVQKQFDVYVENHLTAVSPTTGSYYWDVNTVYVSPGKTTTLKVKVSADNMDGLTYTWTRHPGTSNTYFNGSWEQLDGTGASLKTGKINGPYIYQCRIEDKYGSQHYCSFRVLVENHLQVFCSSNGWAGENIFVKSGARKTLKAMVKADDTTGLKWQWYRATVDTDGYYRWETIDGATKASVKTGKITEFTHYRCEVTDKYGETASCQYYLGIKNNLRISTDLEYRDGGYIVTVPKGQRATLKVNVDVKDGKGLKIEWREARRFKTGGYEWLSPIDGANGTSYTTPAITEAKSYLVQVTDRYGTANNILYNVYPENSMTLTAASKQFPVVKTGAKVTLKVKVNAADRSGLTYQWVRWDLSTRRNEPIPGATKSSYTVKVDRNAAYRCWVTDKFGGQYMLNFIVTTQEFAASKAVLSSVTTAGKLSWKPIDDAEVVEIQRRKAGEKEWTTIYRDNGEVVSEVTGAFTDSSAKKGVKYQYRIIGHFGNAVTRPSAIKTVTIKK